MFTLNGLSKSGSKYTHKFPGAEAGISCTPQASELLPQGNARCAWMLQEYGKPPPTSKKRLNKIKILANAWCEMLPPALKILKNFKKCSDRGVAFASPHPTLLRLAIFTTQRCTAQGEQMLGYKGQDVTVTSPALHSHGLTNTHWLCPFGSSPECRTVYDQLPFCSAHTITPWCCIWPAQAFKLYTRVRIHADAMMVRLEHLGLTPSYQLWKPFLAIFSPNIKS